MAREATFVVWAAFMACAAVSVSGQGMRAVEQGLAGSSAAGGGVPVQGERGRVPAMVGERGVLPAQVGERGVLQVLLGVRDVEHGVGEVHPMLGEHGSVRVILQERSSLRRLGVGLHVLAERAPRATGRAGQPAWSRRPRMMKWFLTDWAKKIAADHHRH
jgi:hypothetical protein